MLQPVGGGTQQREGTRHIGKVRFPLTRQREAAGQPVKQRKAQMILQKPNENLRALKPALPRPAHGVFKAYEPGYVHVDVKYLPQMADESRRRYLFVAIDRATRWVFVRIYPAKTAANARRFLRDLERAAPMTITRVLTDNVLAREQNAVLGVRSRGIRATGYLWNSCPGGLRRQEVVSSIANTGSDWLPPSPSLRRDPKSQAEGPNIIYEVASCASTAL
jgi:hypothetical protein